MEKFIEYGFQKSRGESHQIINFRLDGESELPVLRSKRMLLESHKGRCVMSPDSTENEDPIQIDRNKRKSSTELVERNKRVKQKKRSGTNQQVFPDSSNNFSEGGSRPNSEIAIDFSQNIRLPKFIQPVSSATLQNEQNLGKIRVRDAKELCSSGLIGPPIIVSELKAGSTNTSRTSLNSNPNSSSTLTNVGPGYRNVDKNQVLQNPNKAVKSVFWHPIHGTFATIYNSNPNPHIKLLEQQAHAVSYYRAQNPTNLFSYNGFSPVLNPRSAYPQNSTPFFQNPSIVTSSLAAFPQVQQPSARATDRNYTTQMPNLSSFSSATQNFINSDFLHSPLAPHVASSSASALAPPSVQSSACANSHLNHPGSKIPVQNTKNSTSKNETYSVDLLQDILWKIKDLHNFYLLIPRLNETNGKRYFFQIIIQLKEQFEKLALYENTTLSKTFLNKVMQKLFVLVKSAPTLSSTEIDYILTFSRADKEKWGFKSHEMANPAQEPSSSRVSFPTSSSVHPSRFSIPSLPTYPTNDVPKICQPVEAEKPIWTDLQLSNFKRQIMAYKCITLWIEVKLFEETKRNQLQEKQNSSKRPEKSLNLVEAPQATDVAGPKILTKKSDQEFQRLESDPPRENVSAQENLDANLSELVEPGVAGNNFVNSVEALSSERLYSSQNLEISAADVKLESDPPQDKVPAVQENPETNLSELVEPSVAGNNFVNSVEALSSERLHSSQNLKISATDVKLESDPPQDKVSAVQENPGTNLSELVEPSVAENSFVNSIEASSSSERFHSSQKSTIPAINVKLESDSPNAKAPAVQENPGTNFPEIVEPSVAESSFVNSVEASSSSERFHPVLSTDVRSEENSSRSFFEPVEKNLARSSREIEQRESSSDHSLFSVEAPAASLTSEIVPSGLKVEPESETPMLGKVQPDVQNQTSSPIEKMSQLTMDIAEDEISSNPQINTNSESVNRIDEENLLEEDIAFAYKNSGNQANLDFEIVANPGPGNQISYPTEDKDKFFSNAQILTNERIENQGSGNQIDETNLLEEDIVVLYENIEEVNKCHYQIIEKVKVPAISSVHSISCDQFEEINFGKIEENVCDYSENDSDDNSSNKSSEFEENICLLCNENSAFVCEGCEKASYCSRMCQETHWELGHYRTCKAREIDEVTVINQ